MCPSCGRIHGRCADAMYPFLCLASRTGDQSWIAAATELFEWTESVVSQDDGSLLNDIDSTWRGITVFYALQLADCLSLHGDLLSHETVCQWERRLYKAALFVEGDNELHVNNVNYSIAAACALYAAGTYLGIGRFVKMGLAAMSLVLDYFTSSGLLFGEGVPRNRVSSKGCRPIDIGYNVEESLPLLAEYAYRTNSQELADQVRKSFRSHLLFMFGDGGWDNSFGTRNFKWTYWGSRTTDGCIPGLLLLSRGDDDLALAARKNLTLLQKCTYHGLLAGGPAYVAANQPICVHHTFEHAKALAKVLDYELEEKLVDRQDARRLPRMEHQGIIYIPEAESHVMTLGSYTATVCHGDWEYLKGGNTSGGSLGTLFHEDAGMILCSSVGEYILKEHNNMQVPYKIVHECLTPRIEAEAQGSLYSSIYENEAHVSISNGGIIAKGFLKDSNHVCCPSTCSTYEYRYEVNDSSFRIHARFERGVLVIPVVCWPEDEIDVTPHRETSGFSFEMRRRGLRGRNVRIEVKICGQVPMSPKLKKVFNLVPGFQAIQIDALPVGGEASVVISVFSLRD